MGLATAKVILENPKDQVLEPIEAEALADSGAVHVCIPEHLRIQLKLEQIDKKEMILADGSKQVVDCSARGQEIAKLSSSRRG
jgi:glutamate mutase epsilon subunit